MAAKTLDITIEQGASFDSTLFIKVPGVGYKDLTGHTARMQIRYSPSSTSALVSLTSPAGTVGGQPEGIDLGGTAGSVRVRMSPTTTAALSFRTAYYDLEVEDSSGVDSRLVQGKVFLSREVTK